MYSTRVAIVTVWVSAFSAELLFSYFQFQVFDRNTEFETTYEIIVTNDAVHFISLLECMSLDDVNTSHVTCLRISALLTPALIWLDVLQLNSERTIVCIGRLWTLI